MNFKEKIKGNKYLNHRLIMKIYPPFLLLGLKVRISKDGRSVLLKVPSRWFYRNNNGTIFGGILLLVSDPFPSLLFEELIPNTKAWSTQHKIEYLRPIKGDVSARFEVTDEHLTYFTENLKTNKSVKKDFEYYFVNKRGINVARITTTTFLRNKRE